MNGQPVVPFIEDEQDILDALNIEDKILATAAVQAQFIFNKIDDMLADKEDNEICEAINSRASRNKIKTIFKNMSCEAKFLLFYLFINQAEVALEWFSVSLKIKKKINYQEFYKRFLELGELTVNDYLVELFLEIYLLEVDPRCLGFQEKE